MKRGVIFSGIVALLIAGLILFAYLHQSQLTVLRPHGDIGLAERNVIVTTVLMSAVVVVPVFFLLFFFAWKYRASAQRAPVHHEPNWDHDSWAAEFSWWLAPTVIVIFLSIIAWQSTHQLDPYVPIKSATPALHVQVVALDWKWLFIYPDQHIATLNMLEIPVGTPVHFDITADAPMNSFWIPSLGGQIMAMPGMTNQLNLVADTEGTYKGSSANISGAGFAGMTFSVVAVSSKDFDAWITTMQGNPNVLDQKTYDSLVVPSENVPERFFSQVSGNIFESAILKYMMPAQRTSTSANDIPSQSDDTNDMSGMSM